MSNLIKSRYVLNDSSKKYIDSNETIEKFNLYNFETIPVIDEASVASTEEGSETFTEDGFRQGIAATKVDTLTERISTEAYQDILEKAKLEAEQIINQARFEAEEIKDRIYEESKNQGHKDGRVKAELELVESKKYLEQQKVSQEQLFVEKVNELESKFADLVTLYVEKLTGIAVAESKNVISYLIHNALLGIDSTKTLSIRVSREDYPMVSPKIKEFEEVMGKEDFIEIKIDNALTHNSCLLETDTSIIDCSLDQQLESLKRNITLIANPGKI